MGGLELCNEKFIKQILLLCPFIISDFVSLSPTKRSHEFTSSSTKLENRTPSPDMNSSHQLDQEPPESGSEAILTKGS